MSILIKGVEMPTDGELLCINIHPDGKVCINLDLECEKVGEAVPVPPHGRLIDADALYREIKAECNPYGKPNIGYDDGLKVLGIIGSTPPVIPAEPPKDDDPAGPYDLLYEEGGPDTR